MVHEELHRREQIYRELDISEQQIREGLVRNAREALSDLKGKYGLHTQNS